MTGGAATACRSCMQCDVALQQYCSSTLKVCLAAFVMIVGHDLTIESSAVEPRVLDALAGLLNDSDCVATIESFTGFLSTSTCMRTF